jgi:hypothetical protein
MELVKFLERNQKLQIYIVAATLKVTLCRTIRKKMKKVKNQDSMGKTNFFLSTLPSLPFSPWAISATWLHVGAPHKIQEN